MAVADKPSSYPSKPFIFAPSRFRVLGGRSVLRIDTANSMYRIRYNQFFIENVFGAADEDESGKSEARRHRCGRASAGLDDHASADVVRFGAIQDRGCGVIILKILAAWTLVSAVSSFAIAPALSRRLRDINFPAADE
jgi:hypothetical protein